EVLAAEDLAVDDETAAVDAQTNPFDSLEQCADFRFEISNAAFDLNGIGFLLVPFGPDDEIGRAVGQTRHNDLFGFGKSFDIRDGRISDRDSRDPRGRNYLLVAWREGDRTSGEKV